MIKSRLKVQLAKCEMTQRQLSQITGVRPTTISELALGTNKHLPMNVLDRVCKALNCQPGDILEYIDDEN